MIHQVTNSRANFNYNAFIYENITWETHFHKNFELIYSIEGTHTIYIEQKKHTLNKGELLLIPPNTIHSFTIEKNKKAWVGVFSSDYIAHFAMYNSNKLFSKFKCRDFVDEYLQKTLFFQGTPKRYVLKSALYAVCNECLENASVVSEKKHMDVLNAILDYISENFNTPITMKTMAESLGYEYHYFSTIFHKCFEMNFKIFLNLYRYEKACELLEHEENSITQIALASGFQSIRSFNDAFKFFGGVTPTEYRKQLK